MKNKIKCDLGAVIDCFGEPNQVSGNYYKWQCPLCKDSHKDNLVFNKEKRILWCFANESHAPLILKDMLRKKKIKIEKADKENAGQETIPDKYKAICNDEKQKEFYKYMQNCNRCLYIRPVIYEYLFVQRGIRKETLNHIPLGYDVDRNLWTIPTIEYTTNNDKDNIILGFEYRPIDFSNKKGIFREKGTPTGLAMINQYTSKMEILIIVEGYFDGYTLWQFLDDKGQSDYYHIVTPSNGVTSLLKYMPQIDFDKYKKFQLFLDNDDAGNSVAQQIIEKHPMFKRIILPCGCKDFNEHYIKCLKGSDESNA